MSGKGAASAFVDTNVFVYAAVVGGKGRSPAAQRLVERLMDLDVLCTSTQVLQELFVTLARKAGGQFTAEQTLRYIDRIAQWPVFAPDYGAVREAIELSLKTRLSFWDALIVVAAARSGAKHLYTEDLQHGRKILGVEIVNPFRAPGDD